MPQVRGTHNAKLRARFTIQLSMSKGGTTVYRTKRQRVAAWLVLATCVPAALGAATGGSAATPPASRPNPAASTAPAAPANLPREGSLDLGGGVKMEFVLVPAGSFMMGSPRKSQWEGQGNEGPVHKVTITRPFYIGKYEVTVAQFAAFVKATNYQTFCEKAGNKGAGVRDGQWGEWPDINWQNPGFEQTPQHPVVLVSWNDAQAFAAWLSKQTGRDIRLPTEAQWEYAARGPKSLEYPFGEKWDGSKVNHRDAALQKSGWDPGGCSNDNDGYAYTAPVGKFDNASWCGAFDMVGNVGEFVQDWEADYSAGPQVDPQGPAAGQLRVKRGSNWVDRAETPAAYRERKPVDGGGTTNGFRVTIALPAPGAGGPAAAPATPEPSPAAAAAEWPFDAAEAALRQDAAAKALGIPKETTLDLGGGATLRLTLIPPGKFLMGSPESEPGRFAHESPRHEVTISKPFYMGVHEVTQQQYQALSGVNPSQFKAPSQPVEKVSLDDANDFCVKASAKTGRAVRLPTEAEWEWACRAGTATRYGFGDRDEDMPKYGNYGDSTFSTTWPGAQKNNLPSDGQDRIAPVGSYLPNAWGLYDVHGNVWEWCSDPYADQKDQASAYYARPNPVDPQGSETGNKRVVRGGCWRGLPSHLRSAHRLPLDPGLRLDVGGFRVVVAVAAAASKPPTTPPAVTAAPTPDIPCWPAAEEGQWPRFRGPGGAGISNATTIPVVWTDKDYNWKVKLPGPGHSSPVVWGRRLFVTCGDLQTATRMILCFDADDGRKLWQKDYPSQTFPMAGDCNYATSTPAADADGIVVTWTTPQEVTLLALDNSGQEVWRRNLGPWSSHLGSGTSPVIVGDVAVLTNEQQFKKNQDGSLTMPPKGFLIGVDRKTGETRWQLDRNPATFSGYSTPCSRLGEDGRLELAYASTGHGVTGIDPAAGKVKWEMPGAFQEFVSSPVVGAGLVIVRDTHHAEPVRVVAVRPGNPATGQKPSVAYEMRKRGLVVITPLVKDGRLFLYDGDGTVFCHNVATGDVIWRQRPGGRFCGSPVWVDRRLYCISRDGEGVVLAASDKYEPLARVPLGEPSLATPAVANGVMYLRTETQLFSLGGKKTQ